MRACLHHDGRRSPTPWIQQINTPSTTPILNITLLHLVTLFTNTDNSLTCMDKNRAYDNFVGWKYPFYLLI